MFLTELANSSITWKVKGVTQDFVILYLILTNKDKIGYGIKMSGTWEKTDMSAAMFVRAGEAKHNQTSALDDRKQFNRGFRWII